MSAKLVHPAFTLPMAKDSNRFLFEKVNRLVAPLPLHYSTFAMHCRNLPLRTQEHLLGGDCEFQYWQGDEPRFFRTFENFSFDLSVREVCAFNYQPIVQKGKVNKRRIFPEAFLQIKLLLSKSGQWFCWGIKYDYVGTKDGRFMPIPDSRDLHFYELSGSVVDEVDNFRQLEFLAGSSISCYDTLIWHGIKDWLVETQREEVYASDPGISGALAKAFDLGAARQRGDALTEVWGKISSLPVYTPYLEKRSDVMAA